MAAYKLKIDGTLVCETPRTGGSHCQRGRVGQVSLVSLKRNYDDAAELTFRVDRLPWQPAFQADSLVELFADSVRVFCGLNGVMRPSLSLRDAPSQIYVARDHSYALKQAPFRDKWDYTSVTLAPGKLSAVLAEWLPLATAELTRVGVDTVFAYSGGAADMLCLGPTVQGGDVDAGFREIAASSMGVRAFLDPSFDPPRYRFVQVYNSAGYDIVFEQVRVEGFDPEISLDGRCGAVRTAHGTTGTEGESEREDLMVAAWDPALSAADYSIADADTQPTDSTEAGAPIDRSEMYRRWSFAAFAANVPRNAEMVAVVKGVSAYVQPRYVEVVSVDWAAQTVLLKFPAIADRLPPAMGGISRAWICPGFSKVGECYLRYKASAGIPGDTEQHRLPPAGFGGRAYAMAPITCGWEKLIDCPSGVDRDEYARQAYGVFTEPVCNGNIPLNAELPAGLWLLDRRINVVRESGEATGYEQLLAPAMGIEVDFQASKSRIEFSTDQSLLLRGAVG